VVPHRRIYSNHRSPPPAQAILGITEAFKADSNPKKINLGG
jgi:aspartate/tyrosine/aromatic aminotransferase